MALAPPLSGLYLYTLAIYLIIYSYLFFTFTVSPWISSLASDSVNYILLGQYFSPWTQTSDVINSILTYQDYPKFFPMILGITDATHNLMYAHFLSSSFLIFALILLSQYLVLIKYDKTSSILILFIFSLLPSTWINSIGILSENLYIALSILIFFLFELWRQTGKQKYIYLSLLFSIFAFLTKTIGIIILVLISFIFAREFSGRLSITKKRKNIFIALIIMLAIILEILTFQFIPEQYKNQTSEIYSLIINNQILPIEYFKQQVTSIHDAWKRAWLIYWFEDLSLRHVLVNLVGALAIIGMSLRIKEKKIDAYYTLFYIIFIMLWPYPGQSSRFLYPILPFLIIYFLYSISALTRAYAPDKLYVSNSLSLIICLIIILPTTGFTFHRFQSGVMTGINHVTEYYREPDISKATLNAEIQLKIMNDISNLKSLTQENDVILFFEPSYISALANRPSMKFITPINDDEYIEKLKESKFDYVFISRIIPKRTREDINGNIYLRYFEGWTDVVWTNKSTVDNEYISILLKKNQSS